MNFCTDLRTEIKFIWYILSLLVAFIYSGWGMAIENPDIRFTRLLETTGLTQNSITEIIQDREGYIWVATLGGLHKFDGRAFERISLSQHEPNDSQDDRPKTHLPSGGEVQQINALIQDSDGNLWVGASQSRVFKINRQTGQIEDFTLRFDPQAFDVTNNDGKLDKPFGGAVQALYQDRSGRIWIGSTLGLAVYDPQDDSIILQPKFIDGPDTWKNVMSFAIDSSKELVWLGSSQGLYLVDLKQHQVIEHYYRNGNDPGQLSSNLINSILVEHQHVWVGTVDAGVNRIDRKARAISAYRNNPRDSSTLGADFIRKILKDSQGRLWVATQGGGVALYQPQQDNFRRFVKDKDNMYGLPNNNVWSIFEDHSSVIWFGTAGSGIVQLIPSTSKFEVIQSIPYKQNSMSDDFVWSLAFDNTGVLWIATLDGLNSYDPQTGAFGVYRYNPPQFGELQDNQIISLVPRDGSSLWLGNNDGKVLLFDINDHSFKALKQPQFKTQFHNSRIWNLHVDQQQYLWISTNNGLYRLSPQQQQQALRGETHFEPLLNETVRVVYQDESDNFWLGTQTAGVMVLNPQLQMIAQLNHEPQLENSLSHNTVRTIKRDIEGTMWIGTHSGLNKMRNADSRSIRNQFQHFYIADGLANDTIYSIVEEAPYLWLATNHGLIRIDTRDSQIVNYDVNDGLSANEFNGGAAIKGSQGTLYFGSVHGITYFKSAKIVRNAVPPKLAIGRIQVNNRTIGNPLSTHFIETLTLPHFDNNLVFHFFALDYHQPQLNQLKYRLYPYQQQWELSTNGRTKYNNLPAGQYQFQLMGSNNDGVWAEKVKTLDVTIKPPYWLHPAAFLLYLVTAVYLLYIYHKSERAQKTQLEEMVAKRTQDLAQANLDLAKSIENLEEARETAVHANELKSTFLANMSHEIRTPLTAIIGFTEHALNPAEPAQEKRDYLQRVLRSGRHLLQLINELLDLSKIEAEKLELEHHSINLFELMADIESFSLAAAQEQGLAFHIYYEYPLPLVFNGDLFRIRQILYNLCSNGIKFTREGKVSILIKYLPKSKQLYFSIQDSGIGMSSEELKRLFQPFVQADSSITRQFGGSGLGLVISQKLLHLMKGELTVESTKGKGSHFDVFLPTNIDKPELVLDKPHFSLTEHAKEQQIQQYANAQILVAEDNEDNQLLIKLLLKPFGVKVMLVENGILAVESAMLDNFDLILMDIQMPIMGGVEAVTLLRNAGIECPIIALTANVMKEDIDSYLNHGFNGTLAKPIQNKYFFETINHYLGKLKSDQVETVISALDEIKLGDEFKRIQLGFRNGIPNIIARFEQLLAQQAWEDIRQQAHSVKGSASTMGFPELTEKATKIESLLLQGEHQQVKAAVAEFIRCCESYL